MQGDLGRNVEGGNGRKNSQHPLTVAPQLQAIVLLQAEPRVAREKVKLCKLMVKRRKEEGGKIVPRGFDARPPHVRLIYCDSKEKYKTDHSLSPLWMKCLTITEFNLAFH